MAAVLVQEFIPEDHDQIQRDSEITGDEVLVVPLAVGPVCEHVEVLEHGDQDAEEERAV